ncbi:MAG: hypothetical protein JO091_08720 [Acidobacteriaceae bacterium]|nr:hypothetical protein [Acidobacteriaceae bacterium]
MHAGAARRVLTIFARGAEENGYFGDLFTKALQFVRLGAHGARAERIAPSLLQQIYRPATPVIPLPNEAATVVGNFNLRGGSAEKQTRRGVNE